MEPEPSTIGTEEPLAVAVVGAIHSGDVDALRRLLTEHPGLASARFGNEPDGMSRTLLHVATDWPGHFPEVASTLQALIDAGADVNARFCGPHGETPLHWAASSNDVVAVDVLLDAGADIEIPGAIIAGGPPLADACAFGNWEAAYRLVERGAYAALFNAAALGLLDRVAAVVETSSPAAGEVNGAFWAACHGGRAEVAEYLLDRGAELDWIPDWEPLTPLDAARRSDAVEVVRWLLSRGARSASDLAR